MKIAITGGRGLLGKYLIRYILSECSDEVVILSRNVKDVEFDADLISTSYSKYELIQFLKGYDAVVHLASQRGNSANVIDYMDNLTVTQNLYEACVENSIKNIVYASTIVVYSEGNPIPWNEAQAPKPSTVYGISKLSCESLGDLYNRNYNLRIKNLRFPPLYGELNSKNTPQNRMIDHFISQFLNGLPITVNTFQRAKREYLYAKDAARAIYLALMKPDLCGTLNIGSGEALTNKEVATILCSNIHSDSTLYTEYKDEVLQIDSLMDSEFARKTIGYEPQFTFQESVVDLMREKENV